MIWMWTSGILAFLLLLDALRLRGKTTALPSLPPSDEPPDPQHRFFVRPGVAVTADLQRAASAFARAQRLEILDLVPVEMPALQALAFLQTVEGGGGSGPAGAADLFAPGRTAGQFLLVHEDVLARAGVGNQPPPADLVGFIRLAARLRPYAVRASGAAAAPDLRPSPEDGRPSFAALRELFGAFVSTALLAFPGVLALLVLGVTYGGWVGLAAAAAFQLQPLIALGAGPLRPCDLAAATLLRIPLEIARWAALLRGMTKPSPEAETIASLRPTYGALLATPRDRLFLPRQTTCPVCGAGDLTEYLSTPDLLQHKPGTFALERCRACGHVFQNPRLSIEGLNFYYRDFYDGLGEEGFEFIFAAQRDAYVARAKMLAALSPRPGSWLDVGCGHGHFCCAARDILPSTPFHGLDMSESVDEAVRRRWIDHGVRGLFPDLAPTMAETYDVVSMSHYLEHTLDPRRELAAARAALRPGGRLLIEVPDPEWPLAGWMGRYWVGWFQPQHLHLLSTTNLDRLLREHGFVPEAWHRGPAHLECDFLVGLALLLGRLAPRGPMPWLPPASPLGVAWRALVWTLALPLFIVAGGTDRLTSRLARRIDRSNTYRVIARKE